MRATAVTMILALCVAGPASSAEASFSFTSIEGEVLSMAAWRGQPVLVVNTASRCAFTPQYDELQALYDLYRDRGLVVLAVPSNDFRQELGDAAAVKAYCELNFALTLPMTDITTITGPDAHPFYRWLATEHSFTPGWNFNKVLIGPDGALLATWGSGVNPTSGQIIRAVEAVLPR